MIGLLVIVMPATLFAMFRINAGHSVVVVMRYKLEKHQHQK
jgi:hypothetical protein